MSRTELAEATGLAVPSVHRLVADLVDSDWVVPAGEQVGSKPGRPTTRFRFRDERALLLGVDVGSATTRFALASLDGVVHVRSEVATSELRSGLSAGVRAVAHRMRRAAGMSERPIAAAGVGVPAVVGIDGRLTRPWLESSWTNLPLREQLSKKLHCDVAVAQDNHFAALAEVGATGTAPNASALVVAELGIGVGAGLIVGGHIVSGAEGGLGRLMGWPCTPLRGVHCGDTLGQLLTAEGLLEQYRSLGGTHSVNTGLDLLMAAGSRDRVAARVVRWAGREFDDTLQRIALLLNPSVIVVGGGLGRGLFESGYVDRAAFQALAGTCELRVSVLGEDAVVTGALRAAHRLVPDWLSRHLARAR